MVQDRFERVPVYLVYKFFPGRCPNCEKPFSSDQDFARWGGRGGGKTFIEAKQKQLQLFNDIFKETQGPNGKQYSNKFDMDFIICNRCRNVTLIINHSWRQVLTQAEADRLITEEGFNYYSIGCAVGNHVRPMSQLSFLANADLENLKNLLIMGRLKAETEADEFKGGDTLASVIDPALIEIVNKIRESELIVAVQKRLMKYFGKNWSRLGQNCRDFLQTAEVLKDELISLAETDSTIDFSPAVATYSKAFESELSERIFEGFAQSSYTKELFFKTINSKQERSLDTLKAFVSGQKLLTLGDMAYILFNLGQSQEISGNGFSIYFNEKINNQEYFFNEFQYPKRVMEYVREFRNRSAHVSKLTKEECMEARSFLIDEPIRLLVVLNRSIR